MFANYLIRVSKLLEAPVRWVGALLGVLLLLVVAGEFAVVLLRYGWQWSQTWLREGVLALNSAVFLLGAAYALQHDEHVRVDVLSRHWSARTRAWVEVAGMLLMVLPFAIFIVAVSDQYVLQSWRIGERSQESSGLPAVWVQKALKKIQRVREAERIRQGQEPSAEEIGRQLDLPAERVRELLATRRYAVSLDAELPGEEGGTLGSLLQDDKSPEIADAVLFLCAETGRGITGATLDVNCGSFMG